MVPSECDDPPPGDWLDENVMSIYAADAGFTDVYLKGTARRCHPMLEVAE